MKILVNKAACVGHARCAAAVPELFDLDDSGYIAFSEKDVPQGLEAQARRGARSCPERIISIVESEQAA